VLIQSLGVRSVYVAAAAVMVTGIVVLSAAIHASAREQAAAHDRSLAPAIG
jgi:hypothetical protein